MGRLYPRTMNLPTKAEAQQLLEQHVQDTYQRHHALMVATAMEGYANLFQEDPNLWYVTGRLHDIDFEQHPESHPRESLQWFKTWNYPEALIHAVEAHAYGYHGYTTLPQTKLAAALLKPQPDRRLLAPEGKNTADGYGYLAITQSRDGRN